MKIILSITTLYRGGAERVVTNLANELVKKGHDITILLYRKSEIGYTLDDNIKVIVDDVKSERIIQHILWRRKYLKENDCDVLLSFLDQLSIINILAAIGLKVPIIVANRDDPRFSPQSAHVRKIRNFLFRFADKVIVQNQHNLAYFSKCIQEKGSIIYNAVDMKGYERKAINTPKKNKIVWVGRLTNQKNPEMMIEVFRKFNKSNQDYFLHLYGDGVKRETLQNLINNYHMEDKIILEGSMSNIFECIADARLFVMTSNFEGMPNALLEAMCIGLPVISTKVAGATDVIEHGKNGFLVDCNDAKQLLEYMSKILSDSELQCQFSENASKIYDKLKTDMITEQWVDEIQKSIYKRSKVT